MDDPIERLRSAIADRYAIRRALGRGGMAIVFLADDLKHGRQVAIKVLATEMVSATGAERFLREIEIAARLRHPHIVPLFDSGEAGGLPYFVMPYVEGESLRDRIDRDTQLPVQDALRIAREVADALSYAHSHDVLHRDIKPENILLDSGHAVVADFGIARAIAAVGAGQLTETGLAIGTPAYMSPEQASGTAALDARSDLYGLACVLYEMLAGEPPHTAPTPQAIIAKRVGEVVPSIKAVRDTVPEAVQRALTRALAKAPADRFATAAEFAQALGEGAGPEWVTRPTGRLRVVGLYALAALAVLSVVQFLMRWLDLPGWVLPAAIVLLLIGFPIILGSALVQRGELRTPRTVVKLLTWRPALLGGMAAFAALGLAVTGYVLFGGTRATPASTLEESFGTEEAVAVLPFRAVGADAAFWHEGMVDMLSDDIEGIDGLRKVDPRVVLSAWARSVGQGSDAPDTEAAIEVARLVGARYAITGSATQLERSVRLSAEVYDVERGRLRGSAAKVDGSPDSVISLVDRLTVELLRRGKLAPGSEQQPGPDLSQVTTRSLPALKAYLAGEQKYRQSRWKEAAQDFRRAVELDSTFARAWYRLAGAYGWSGESVVEPSLQAARLAARLPERDSLLLTASAVFSPATIPILEKLVRRYPDHVEGWRGLGDKAYFHLGPSGLYPSDAFRSALYQALALDPSWGETYPHLIEDAFSRLDSVAAQELIDGYRRTRPEQDPCPMSQIAYDLMWGDHVTRQRALQSLDAFSGPAQIECQQTPLRLEPAAVEKLEQIRRVALSPEYPEAERTPTLWRMLQARLPLGHFDAGRRLLTQAAAIPVTRIDAARWDIMLHLSGFPDSSAVGRAAELLSGDPSPLDHFWLGVLAVGEGRWSDVEHAAAMMEAQDRDWSWAESRRDSLQAGLAKRYADALRTYAELWQNPGGGLQGFETALRELPSMGWSIEEPEKFLRYQVGRILVDNGRLREAKRYFESFHHYHWPYVTPARFYLGTIHEELGDVDRALEQYEQFIRWWEDADPELQPWREEARQALIRLMREPM